MNLFFNHLAFVGTLTGLVAGCAAALPQATKREVKPVSSRSFETGKYRDLFREQGYSEPEIQAKIDAAWKQLFYGDDATQRVYYPVGADEAYIKDVGSNDIRSEGMSYGLMIAVQMDKREEFDRLWRWTKRHMQHQDGPWKGYLAWHCDETGKKLSSSPAPDGEEFVAMAMFFAAGRWKGGTIDYRAEADRILRTMLHKEEDNGGIVDTAMNAFNRQEKQVVFVPNGDAAGFTDPSYHLPAFYELWGRWAKEDRPFWKDAAKVSRKLFRKAAHPKTGLFPDYSAFDGRAIKEPWDSKSTHDQFRSDAFRVGANIAMDWNWFGTDPWAIEQSDRMLRFFDGQGPEYRAHYTLDGQPTAEYRSTGLVAMNAVVASASGLPSASGYVRALWESPIPSGQWRYYDGMLYTMALLHASGRFRIWTPR